MEQNIQLWLGKQGEKSALDLSNGVEETMSVIQPIDGKFSYELWALTKLVQDVECKVSVNGRYLCYHAAVTASEELQWTMLACLQLTKGEHSITLGLQGEEQAEIKAVLLTHDSGYINRGTALEHYHQIIKGAKIEDLLESCGIGNGIQETAEEKRERLDRLYREGFLERYDQDLAEGISRCGVPLGGIGAGKLELDEDGVFTSITINNNAEVPLFKTEGSFFAVNCKSENNSVMKLLQKVDYQSKDLPLIEKIEFEGIFPEAKLHYLDKELPIDIKLTAFSGLTPYNEKDSSLPGIVFEVELSNLSNEKQEISLMFSFENMIGAGGSMAMKSPTDRHNNSYIKNTWNPGNTWSDRTGNYQRVEDNMLLFEASDSHGNLMSYGNYALTADVPLSFVTSYEVDHLDEMLGGFAKGELPSTQSVAEEDTCYVAGAGIATVMLQEKESKKFSFVLAWYMPHLLDKHMMDMGVYYDNHFSSSKEVASYLLKEKNRIYQETTAVQKAIMNSSFEPWLKKKILNDMFPIYTCSWFNKEEMFSINEAPAGMMGCLGTMDQRLACNAIYTNFYPKLDAIELELFRLCQGENGSISHDLGFGAFDISKRGGDWSDLCSSYILQVYKYYSYTGDEEFLEKMYPSVKAAVAYQKSIDRDENSIPDVGAGNGTTYDTYHWYGTSSFVASLWLAQLKACIKLANHKKDQDFALECEELFEKAQSSMISELWNTSYEFGNYFNSYHDSLGGTESENCFISQLAGQWFADLMDLGKILPQDMLDDSIKTITERNMRLRNMEGFNDETTPQGDFAWYAYSFLQYNQVYYGCLAIYNGFVEEGMECFRKVYEMTKDTPWNIALTYFAEGGHVGLPYYMTNPASSFLLEAVSGFVPNIPEKNLQISPNWNQETLKVPLFTPKFWLELDYKKLEREIEIAFTCTKTVDDIISFESFTTLGSAVKRITVNQVEYEFIEEDGKIIIKRTFEMKEGLSYRIKIETK